MIYAAMVFAWIVGILLNLPVVFTTSVVMDGMCHAFSIWESPAARLIYGAVSIFIVFILPLVVFIYCYSRIIVVMRRQMKVMAGHNIEGGSQMNASQIQSKQIKWNIIKMMLIVSVAFIICWFPFNIYWMIIDNTTQTSNLFIGYFPTVFLAYLYA